MRSMLTPRVPAKAKGPADTGQALDFIGGRTRTRTLDPLIKSQLLYQLSYAPAREVGR